MGAAGLASLPQTLAVPAGTRHGVQALSAASRVLCLPDVTGGHIALLPVGLGQPPLLIACDVLKLQDPESLVS